MRTVEALLDSVPSAESFRSALGLIKAWARARGVYGKGAGFFGGIAWALLTAAACQRLPASAAPSTIVATFFSLWAAWPWPTPVELRSQGGGGADAPKIAAGTAAAFREEVWVG